MPRSIVSDLVGNRSTRMWCQPSTVSRVNASISSPKPSAVSRKIRSPALPSMAMKFCMASRYSASGHGTGPWHGHLSTTRESSSGPSLQTVKISE